MVDPQPIHQVLNAAWRRKIQICSIACIVLGVFSICLEVGYVEFISTILPYRYIFEIYNVRFVILIALNT